MRLRGLRVITAAKNWAESTIKILVSNMPSSVVRVLAVAAQQNAWEALALYSAALLAISLADPAAEHLATAAVLVLICRILHGIFYLADLDKLRSLSFAVGTLPCFYLFYLAISSS